MAEDESVFCGEREGKEISEKQISDYLIAELIEQGISFGKIDKISMSEDSDLDSKNITYEFDFKDGELEFASATFTKKVNGEIEFIDIQAKFNNGTWKDLIERE